MSEYTTKQQIETLEQKVIDLATEIRQVGVNMTFLTYDHWGTLDVNLNSLMRAARFLSEDIRQQMEQHDT
jgi:energy-converting hydrogenase Eha subunit E